MSVDHRKSASKNRNGRSRYEKGCARHKDVGRDPLKSRKGDFKGLKHGSDKVESKLADVWPS